MKAKLLVSILPVFLMLFTACGGNDSPTAPATNLSGTEHPDDKASREDLEKKVALAKTLCVQAYQPVAMAAAPIIYSQPGLQVQVLMQQGSPVSGAMAQTQSQQSQCANALQMSYYNIKTMQNGKYFKRKDVQDWYQSNLAYIGDAIVSNMPPVVFSNPQFVQGMRNFGAYTLNNNLMPQLTDPSARFALTQQLSTTPY